MEIISLSVILFTVLLTLLYLYIKKCQSYWKDNNVVHLEPEFLFGNFKRVLNKEILIIDVNEEIYNKVKDQGKTFGGIYSFLSPIFIPVDLDLIKNILQTDFSYFINHGAYINEKKEPLTVNIFNLEDNKWKNLRAKLSPTFTTGKMKMMFPTLDACSKELEILLKETAENVKNGIDIKDIIGRYSTDTISSVGFGLEAHSMKNPQSDFRKYGKMFFDSTLFENRVWFAFTFLPRWFTTRLNLRTMPKAMETFYMNLVRDTVAYREKHNIYRKDMLHLLIQLKNLGEIGDDDDKRLLGENMNNAPGLTMNELTAQVFLFMVAGFETASATSTYALLELAQRQDIQDKLREEIIEVLKKHDNKLSYEAISEMEYLEKTVLETGRKRPTVPFLIRICGKDYRVPNTNFVLKAGTKVNIPLLQIQNDPKYYPDPDNFDPERFSAENKAKRHPMTYLPFGEGPRNCIGLRFGKLQAKIALCTILRNYRVTLNEKTQMPIKYEMIFSTSVKGGVWINLEPLS